MGGYAPSGDGKDELKVFIMNYQDFSRMYQQSEQKTTTR